jgi:hypothetical protein
MFRLMVGIAPIGMLCAAALAIAAEPTADGALREAMRVLESRRSGVPTADQATIDLAHRRLQELLPAAGVPRVTRRIPTEPGSPAEATIVNVVDFIDNTPRYRGQTVTLPLMVRSTPLSRGRRSLRDMVGGSARFMSTAEDGNRLDMTIDLPAGLDVPKAFFADRVVVSFRCDRGELQRGNVALSIDRPPHE